MRLWHKDLIHILPRQQLLGQWRECCAIARNITKNGWPNNLLVDKIMDYMLDHFCSYSNIVFCEMCKRGYCARWQSFSKYMPRMRLFDRKENDHYKEYILMKKEDIFPGWHTKRYLTQCFYNLQEKYDCGGISEKEWDIILKEFPADCL